MHKIERSETHFINKSSYRDKATCMDRSIVLSKKYILEADYSNFEFWLRIDDSRDYKIYVIKKFLGSRDEIVIIDSPWNNDTVPILCPYTDRASHTGSCYTCDITKYLSFEYEYFVASQSEVKRDIYQIDCLFDIVELSNTKCDKLIDHPIRLRYNGMLTPDFYRLQFVCNREILYMERMLYNFETGRCDSWKYYCDLVQAISYIIDTYQDNYLKDIIDREIMKFIDHMLSKFGPEIMKNIQQLGHLSDPLCRIIISYFLCSFKW